MIAKYRKAEYPGEWWITDFTMEQLERRLEQLETKNESLRKAIFTAPHNMGCACLQGGPTRERWGKLEFCDCWKKDALG